MLRTNKYLRITVYSFLISCAIIAFFNISSSSNHFRHLLDNTSVNKICSNASSKLNETYNNGETIEYVFKPSNKHQPIIEYFKDQDINHIKDYILRILPYGIFIVIGGVCLLGWIPCCICCWCPCCCCNPKNKTKCCKRVSFFGSLICFGAVVIGSVFGIIFAPKLFEGINGTSCSLLKFYLTVIEGEQKETIPKWNGMNKIKDGLGQTINSIDSVNSNAQNFSPQEPGTLLNTFKNYVGNLFASISLLKHPYDDNSDQIMADYAQSYNGENSVVLNAYVEEYNNTIMIGARILSHLKENIELLESSTDGLKEKLNSALDGLTGIDTTLSSLADDVGTNGIKYQNYFNDYSTLVTYILFGCLIFFAFFGGVNIFFYVTCAKCQLLRFSIHLVWNFMVLLMFITFLLGSIIGLLGVVGTDVVGVLSYTFSIENLASSTPIILSAGDSNIYGNTCINENGDGSQAFNFKDVNANALNDIYNSIFGVKAQLQILEGIEYPTNLIKMNNEELQGIINNINTAILDIDIKNYGKTTINSQDNQMYWTLYENGCPIGYKGFSTSTQKEVENYCYAIFSYWEKQISLNSFCTNGDNNCKTVVDQINKYIEYFEVVNEQTKLFVTQNNKISVKSGEDKDLIVNSLKEAILIPVPGTEIFSNVVGEENIFSIINCGFMKSNGNILFQQLDKEMGYRAILGSTIGLSISLCEMFAVIFGGIVTLRYKKQNERGEKGERIPKEDINNGKDHNSESQLKIQNQNDIMQQVELVDMDKQIP